jgi:nitric oxide reductase large subunit
MTERKTIGNKGQAQNYKRIFGTEGKRNAAQEQVWQELVMEPLLEASRVETKTQRTARDTAIKIFKLVEEK